MKNEALKDKLGDWYDPLKFKITDTIYDKIYEAAKQYSKTECYPEPKNIFRAFEETSYKNLSVVILGQDPYHDGNATGLCFDCKNKVTPSMRSIQDAYQDYNPYHFNTDILEGKIDYWSKQGVLLLNTALTVEKGKPNSHKKYWDDFTIEVIKAINKKEDPVVFMLWGSQAQSYEQYIDTPPHTILKAEHPVAGKYQGRKWKHNDCFSKCNRLLLETSKPQIQW